MKAISDFRKLEALRNACLVEAVGHLPAERGKKKIGRDEDRSRELRQSFGFADRRF